MKTHLLLGAAGGLILILFDIVRYLIDPMWVLGEHGGLFNAIGFGISITYLLAIIWILRSRSKRDRTTYWPAFKMLFVVLAVMNILPSAYDSLFRSWKGKELKTMHEQEIKALIRKGEIQKYTIGIRPIPPSQKEMGTEYNPVAIEQQEVEETYQRVMKPDTLPLFINSMLVLLIFISLLSLLLAFLVRAPKPSAATAMVPENE